MKILSNFDTKLYDTIREDYVGQYGKENVMVIRRASIFFWLYIIAPAFLMFIILASMIWLSFGLNIKDSAMNAVIDITVLVAALAILIVRGYRLFKKYLDYTMDYCIITPKEIISYNQSGLFNRHTEIIDTEKIKTINKIPKGLFGSLFNFADLIFLSEGDKDMGDINLHYVENPEDTYKQVRYIIEPHLNQIAGEQVFIK